MRAQNSTEHVCKPAMKLLPRSSRAETLHGRSSRNRKPPTASTTAPITSRSSFRKLSARMWPVPHRVRAARPNSTSCTTTTTVWSPARSVKASSLRCARRSPSRSASSPSTRCWSGWVNSEQDSVKQQQERNSCPTDPPKRLPEPTSSTLEARNSPPAWAKQIRAARSWPPEPASWLPELAKLLQARAS